jgi:methionyl-tRNA formyltransferase
VTVHYVDHEYDQGRIIAQWPVPVLADDDARTLAQRVLRVEHVLFPRAIDAVIHGRLTPASCIVSGPRGKAGHTDAAFTLQTAEESSIVEDIELALGC